MYRPFLTACVAVVLSCASLGAADAAARTSQQSAVAVHETSTPPADRMVAVEQRAAAAPELAGIATTSQMPTADADLRMWSAAATQTGPVLAGGLRKKGDAIHRFARGIISRTSTIAMSLTRDAMRYIGTPYVFGGTSPSGFDCSGYVQHVFAMLGIALPRTADAQYYAGRATRGGMVTGDLVFFQTYEPGPSHVGIYLGRGRFIHSSSHGVMISRIADSYWSARYLGAKRVAARFANR